MSAITISALPGIKGDSGEGSERKEGSRESLNLLGK